MKLCTRCGLEKDATQFYSDLRTKDRLRNRCKPCHAALQREWRAENADRVREQSTKTKRAWYAANKDKVNAGVRAKRKANPMPFRRRKLSTHYGLSSSEFDRMLLAQNNQCAICRSPFTKTPHVDHDHVTRNVRGLLCTRCNTGLGCFQDDPSLLCAGVEYLEARQLKLVANL